MMEPKHSFSAKTFLIGLAFLIAGMALAYYQYQLWFNPEIIAGVAVKKINIGGILLAAAAIVGGMIVIFNAFKGGGQPSLVYLPKEKFDELKKAVETREAGNFEKLLDGEVINDPQEEYAALTIERFKSQPGMATVQASMRVAHPTGSFYNTQNETEKFVVEGAVLEVLAKIEKKYGSQESY